MENNSMFTFTKRNLILNRGIKIFFLTASIYYWIIIPLIREILYLAVGRDRAETVRLSCLFLQPSGVTFAEPEKIPSDLFSLALYYLRPIAELIAFFLTLLIFPYFEKKFNKLGLACSCLLIPFAFAITISVVMNYWAGGLLSFFASLSGIVAVKITKLNSTRQPQERMCQQNCIGED